MTVENEKHAVLQSCEETRSEESQCSNITRKIISYTGKKAKWNSLKFTFLKHFIIWVRYSVVFECSFIHILLSEWKKLMCRYQRGISGTHNSLSYSQSLILSTKSSLLNWEPVFLSLPCSMQEENTSWRQFRTAVLKGYLYLCTEGMLKVAYQLRAWCVATI